MGWLFALLARYEGGEGGGVAQSGRTRGDARLPYDPYEGWNVCQQHSNTSFFIVKLKFNPEDRGSGEGPFPFSERARDYVYFKIGVLPTGLFLKDSVANRCCAIVYRSTTRIMHAPCHAISVVHSFRAEKRSIRRKTGMIFIGIISNVAQIEDLATRRRQIYL